MPTEGKGNRNNSVTDSLCLLNHSSSGAFLKCYNSLELAIITVMFLFLRNRSKTDLD